jgi:hypothetical protein
LRLLAALLALSLLSPPAYAATGIPALDFAEHISPIEPALAAMEYERFLDLNPRHPHSGAARKRLVDLYLGQKDDFRARRHLRLLQEQAPPSQKALWSLQLASLEEIAGRPELARAEYVRLCDDPAIGNTALRHLLWLEIRQRHWEAAAQTTQRFPADARMQALEAALRTWQSRPTLSVNHAQRLSAWLPGSGQAYAGDWASGLASFTLNAAWIGLLAYAVADRDWLGGLLVVNYGPRYYLGGIQKAGNLVSKEQLREDLAFLARLDQEFADLQPLKQ